MKTAAFGGRFAPKRKLNYRVFRGIRARRSAAGIRRSNNKWACSAWIPKWAAAHFLAKTCPASPRDAVQGFPTYPPLPAAEICRSGREAVSQIISASEPICGRLRMHDERKFG